MEVPFDRAPHDFSEPKDTKFQVNAAHMFANHVVLGGSLEPEIKADSEEVTVNLEGTLGYIWALNHVLSLSGSVGVGERFQQETSGGSFPYYVLRIHADIHFDKRWTWNAITYRYRDAFDTANEFNTPEVATGITLKIDDRWSLNAKYYYGWKEGSPDHQGLAIAIKHSF